MTYSLLCLAVGFVSATIAFVLAYLFWRRRFKKIKKIFTKAMYLAEHGHKIGSYERFKKEMEALDKHP